MILKIILYLLALGLAGLIITILLIGLGKAFVEAFNDVDDVTHGEPL